MRRTRTRPSSGSTATSANCAPNVIIANPASRPGGLHTPSASASGWKVRWSRSAYDSDAAPAVITPSRTTTWSGSAPCSGEPASATARRTSWSRSAVPALCTAALIMPAPAEPTAAAMVGRSVSPFSNRQRSTRRPRASAATWVMTVVTPVPKSGVAAWTTAVPSAYTRARARCGLPGGATGQPALAMPVPISQCPARRTPGRGSLPSQPKRAAPRSQHSRRPLLDQGRPEEGLTSAWLRRRSSTGSLPSSWASSSIAHSSASMPLASPGARMKVGVIVLARTIR